MTDRKVSALFVGLYGLVALAGGVYLLAVHNDVAASLLLIQSGTALGIHTSLPGERRPLRAEEKP